jgi:hypothetical protein
MARLHFPRVDRIEQLLTKKKGWTKDDLARKADIRLSTLNSLLVGRGVFMSTLERVATALGIEDHRTLLPSSDPECVKLRDKTEPESSPNIRITMTFTVAASAFADPEVYRLLSRLRELSGAGGEMDVQGYGDGSLIVIVDLLAAQFPKVLYAFADGVLQTLELWAIVIPPQHVPDVLALLHESKMAYFLENQRLRDIPLPHVTVLFGIFVVPLVSAAQKKYERITDKPLIVDALKDGSIRIRRAPRGNRYIDLGPAPTEPSDESGGSKRKASRKLTSLTPIGSPSR